MELRQPWLLLPAAAGVLVLLGVLWLVLGWRRRTGTVALANTELLRRLPEFRAAVRRHRLRETGIAVLALAVAAAALVGAARPVERQLLQRSEDNRDIVLCLDVSGSMIDVDAQLVDTFSQLAEGFRGERLSLVVFNSTAVPVFPLTDDADFVTAQLTRARDALQTLDPEDPFFAGTLNGDGSSLIGDGLATCTRSFDHPELRRTRSIVLATDNEAAGRSLFSLPEAGRLAQREDVQVYGINPSDSPASAPAREMRSVVTATGGLYYALGDDGAVPQILEQVSRREGSRIPATPQVVSADEPTTQVVLAGAGLLALLVVRRLRWRRGAP